MVWSQYSILNIVIHGAQTPKYKIVYVNHLPEYCPVMGLWARVSGSSSDLVEVLPNDQEFVQQHNMWTVHSFGNFPDICQMLQRRRCQLVSKQKCDKALIAIH